jgi:death on curing protein
VGYGRRPRSAACSGQRVTEWIAQDVVLAIHKKQIDEHGGLHGLRDLPTLESTLARPRTLAAYGLPAPDIAALAACYAYGIASKQVFLDGNKRTSSVVTRTFLRLNGYDYIDPADRTKRLLIWKRLGDGSLTEAELTEWMRANIKSI